MLRHLLCEAVTDRYHLNHYFWQCRGTPDKRQRYSCREISPRSHCLCVSDACLRTAHSCRPHHAAHGNISIQLKLPDGKVQIIPQAGELEWQTIIPAENEQQEISATLIGTRFSGTEMSMTLSHKLGEAEKAELKVELPAEAVQNLATAAIDAQGDTAGQEAEQAVKTDPEGKLDWLNVGGVFIAVNILVIGSIVLLVTMIKRRRAKKGATQEGEVDTDL